MIFSYIFLYLKCLYVDNWSNKSIYPSNKIKHLKWFTKYRVDPICDGRTDGQRQRANIRRIQESCNILRIKMCENVLFPLLWRFFLLENTPNFEYGGEAPASHKERQVHMEKEKGGGKNCECLWECCSNRIRKLTMEWRQSNRWDWIFGRTAKKLPKM